MLQRLCASPLPSGMRVLAAVNEDQECSGIVNMALFEVPIVIAIATCRASSLKVQNSGEKTLDSTRPGAISCQIQFHCSIDR